MSRDVGQTKTDPEGQSSFPGAKGGQLTTNGVEHP